MCAFLASLRVRLLLLVVLAFLPAFVLVIYTALEQRRLSAVEFQATAMRVARLAAVEHSHVILESRQLLTTLAQLREVRERDARACSVLVASLLAQREAYANLGAVDPQGEVFCSALPMAEATNVADRAYFRRAVETRTFAVGEYQIGRVTKRAAINVALPVLDREDRAVAVVFAAIDLAWLNRFVEEWRLGEGSTVTVVDQSGTALARYPDGERWIGRPLRDTPLVERMLRERFGFAEITEPDGVERLVAFRPFVGTPATGEILVSVGIPKELASAPARRSLVLNLMLLAAVALVTAVATWVWASVFILRPVHALVRVTDRLATGDLGARTGMRTEGELGRLAQAFDAMAAALERDQDERERAEQERARQREALYRSGRLSDVGRLAAGVTHELKNRLVVIVGRLHLLQGQVEQGLLQPADLIEHHIASLREAIDRMQRTIQNLSTYARPSRVEPMLLDFRELLGSTRDLLAYQARRSNIAVRVEVPEQGLPPVLGDRSQVMQILVNLATNAIEAMEETGGALRLAASVDPTGGPGAGAVVVIEIADTGPGIPAEQLATIWEPFYTTKAERTGLGLSIVRALVAEQPGAVITVESTPGHGTTFRLTIPAASGDSVIRPSR
jgi:signal transduction histidine kinase